VDPRVADSFIRVEGVSKSYAAGARAIQALAPVSFSVAEHQFMSIIGPSGCGKSTLLSLIAGLLPPSSGEIRIGGKALQGPYTSLGIVFQRDVLLDWRTVLDNVMIQAEVRRLDRQAARARARQLLAEVGLDGFEDAYPFELSGGMRQRAAICRALVHDPPLLIMDEPFAALDALTRDQMNLDLQELWQARRKTVLFITHSVGEAVFLSDVVLVMTPRPGRIEKRIAIDLPRPRTLAMREQPEFLRYTAQIVEILKREGVLREKAQR
jgi:NitT/TauT family transport system ATP-binding protein